MGSNMRTELDRLKEMKPAEIETYIRVKKGNLERLIYEAKTEGDVPAWVLERVAKDIECAVNWLTYIKGGDVDRLVNA